MPVCNHMMEWIVQCTVETRNPEMTAPTNNHLPTPKAQMFILHRQELSTFNPEQSTVTHFITLHRSRHAEHKVSPQSRENRSFSSSMPFKQLQHCQDSATACCSPSFAMPPFGVHTHTNTSCDSYVHKYTMNRI